MNKDITVTCSCCGKEYQSSYENIINAQKNPEIIDKILTGELFVHTCPHCNERVIIHTPFYYVDHENKLLIYCDNVDDVILEHEVNKRGIQITKKPEGVEGYKEIGITDPRQFSNIYYSLKYGYDWRIVSIYLAVAIAKFSHDNHEDDTFIEINPVATRLIEDDNGTLYIQLEAYTKDKDEPRLISTKFLDVNYQRFKELHWERINEINPYLFDTIAAFKFLNQINVDLKTYKNATQTVLFCEDEYEKAYICRLPDSNKKYKMEDKIIIFTDDGEIETTVLAVCEVGILDFPRENDLLFEIKEED